MIFQALNESANRGELILVNGAMCRYHIRKDGVLVIREIIVMPSERRKGLGRSIVRSLKLQSNLIIAKCPFAYESNAFWEKVGFSLKSTDGGINTWQLCQG